MLKSRSFGVWVSKTLKSRSFGVWVSKTLKSRSFGVWVSKKLKYIRRQWHAMAGLKLEP